MQAIQVCIRFHHIFKTICNHASKTLKQSGFTMIKSPVQISKLADLSALSWDSTQTLSIPLHKNRRILQQNRLKLYFLLAPLTDAANIQLNEEWVNANTNTDTALWKSQFLENKTTYSHLWFLNLVTISQSA
jgi:hypothetical protein